MSASPVTYFFDEKDKLMTIRISAFSEKTVAGLKATLHKAAQLKTAGLIIDLRSNTGGLLKEAVLAADLFLPENLLMIKTKGRLEQTQQEYISTTKKNRPVYPIVILTDSKTASSAEFLQAYCRNTATPSLSARRHTAKALFRQTILCPAAANYI